MVLDDYFRLCLKCGQVREAPFTACDQLLKRIILLIEHVQLTTKKEKRVQQEKKKAAR
jgi:hypothetical protein